MYTPKYSVVHKTILLGTEVHAHGKRPYKRRNYTVLCAKPVTRFEKAEVMSPYDESVTCPECLKLLGGRRNSNRDVMAAANEIERFNRESEINSWNK